MIITNKLVSMGLWLLLSHFPMYIPWSTEHNSKQLASYLVAVLDKVVLAMSYPLIHPWPES